MSPPNVAPYKSPYRQIPVENALNYNTSSQSPSQAFPHTDSPSGPRSDAPLPTTPGSNASRSSSTIPQQLLLAPGGSSRSLRYNNHVRLSTIQPLDRRVNIGGNQSTQSGSQNSPAEQYQSPYGSITPASPQKTSQRNSENYSMPVKKSVDRKVSASRPKGQSEMGPSKTHNSISKASSNQNRIRQYTPTKTTPSSAKVHASSGAPIYYNPQTSFPSLAPQNKTMNSSKILSVPQNNGHGNLLTASSLALSHANSNNYRAPRIKLSHPEFTSCYGEFETPSDAGPYFFKKIKKPQPHPFNMGPGTSRLVTSGDGLDFEIAQELTMTAHSLPFPRWFQRPADPTLPASLTEFHCFSKLPPKVRVRIWEMCCPQGHQGRIIDVRQKIVDTEERDYTNAGRFYTSTPFPALLQLCKESRKVALESWKEINITSLDHDSLALAYLKHQFPQDPESTFQPQVPARISFRTYINWELDMLYLNPEHMTIDGCSKFYHADGRTYPETSVIRFAEAMAGHAETRDKLRFVGLYKEVLRDNHARHTNLSISPAAFQAISACCLLQLASLSKIGVILDEQCCIDHPGFHNERDQPIVGSRCGIVAGADHVVENGGHLIKIMLDILRQVAVAKVASSARAQNIRLPQFLSIKILRQEN